MWLLRFGWFWSWLVVVVAAAVVVDFVVAFVVAACLSFFQVISSKCTTFQCKKTTTAKENAVTTYNIDALGSPAKLEA